MLLLSFAVRTGTKLPNEFPDPPEFLSTIFPVVLETELREIELPVLPPVLFRLSTEEDLIDNLEFPDRFTEEPSLSNGLGLNWPPL